MKKYNKILMKNEKIKLSKLESIQMSNFLIKKELISYLDEKNKNQINRKKYMTFITNFMEDLFNIINQQILTFAQVQESSSASQIEHLIDNNKNIIFTMIFNFYDKIFSSIKYLKIRNNMSRNFSNRNINCKKKVNLSDRFNKINNKIFDFEKHFFNKQYKTNYNSLENNTKNNNFSSYNINSNLLLLSGSSISKNNSIKNLKLDYIDLNKLENNEEKEEIEIVVKPKKMNEKNNIKNVNNKIILTNKIYKVCNQIPVSRKNKANNMPERKNSFNKKIKFNKINIKKSKNNLKSVNLSIDDNKK